MAKRRRLETPSAEALTAMEAELGERPKTQAMAPIAQVAAEAAAQATPEDGETRAAAARDQADAARLRVAEERGLIIREVALDSISHDLMTRDRAALDEGELAELVASIRASGLRLPIEICPAGDGGEGRAFGLLSGFRRLTAYRRLRSETGDPVWDTIPALVRDPAKLEAAYVAMVEENEVRAELSAYERGRIAVIAAGEGAFASTEAAVDRLFATGSKAKRSKIRSFALVHESLGDLLAFGTALSERQGLQLANAIRAGFEDDLRDVLSHEIASTAEEEWDRLGPVLESAEAARSTQRQTGRPKAGHRRAAWSGKGHVIELKNGMSISQEATTNGYSIQFHGRNVDAELVRTVMLEIERLLG